MRKKLDEYRRRLREEELAERKENIRNNMIEARNREERAEELDCSLLKCIEECQAKKYLKVYTSACKEAICSLPRNTIEESYLFFSYDPMQNNHAAVVKELLINHAPVLLALSRLQHIHNKMIEWAVKEISRIVEANPEDYTLLVENPLIILNIFLSRKYAKVLSIEDSNSFLQSILFWQVTLLDNTRYLHLLTSLLSHPLFVQHWNGLELDCLLFALSRQALTLNDSIAYPSLKALNNLLSKMQTPREECIRTLLSDYLGILQRVFKGATSEGSLMECLNQLQKMLKVVKQMNWRVGLGNAIQQHSTFRLLSSINQIQHFPQRCLVYSIIEYLTHIISEQEDAQALTLLRIELQCTLLLGLGNRFSNQITLDSIRAIQILLRCQSIGYDCQAAVQSFWEGGITTFLEYLQFNRNNEVAWIAGSMLDEQFADKPIQYMK